MSETRRCANGLWYWFFVSVAAVVILAVLATAYMLGKAAGVRYTLAEFENAGLMEGTLSQYDELATALMADLEAERQWTNEFAHLSAEWLYSEPRDPQRAYDLLWCAAGKASPLDNCLQQLVDGRGD